MPATIKDLIAVVEKTPELADNGFRCNSFGDRDKTAEERLNSFNRGRDLLKTECFYAFKQCCEWLLTAQKTKTINKKFGSMGLKEHVEEWSSRSGIKDCYVSNGAFIAAAIHMGFDCVQAFDSPNASFNISSRSPLIVEGKKARYS